ncbi:response regulator transcription factor [Nocardioides sp.]|uniref:response regulator transcription factor n=1 Tax=Nocardioides sp. TaxID=35761 RepID=UPI0035639593
MMPPPTEVTAVRVLIVDDSSDMRELYKHAFAREGFVVVGTAGDGDEAIAAVADLAPDVVVMDVMMPRIDGIAATRQIRAAHPRTQVVALTAFHSPQVVAELFAAGATECVLKGGALSEIAAAIRAAAGVRE